MLDILNPVFTDEDKAREHLERLTWPNGPVCPHCGECENVKRLEGRSHRKGLIQCNSCLGNFTVTVGTVFERSKVPLNKWLLAAFLMSSSKKGMSAHQIHRMLGVTYKKRLSGKVAKAKKVVTLVERDGRARSFHVANIHHGNVRAALVTNVHRSSTLMTDDARMYWSIGREFAEHGTTLHSNREFARPGGVHSNSAENFFSILKRGVVGTYHHWSEAHFARYLAEFDFRYSHKDVTDAERSDELLKGIVGKRLTYRRTAALAA